MFVFLSDALSDAIQTPVSGITFASIRFKKRDNRSSGFLRRKDDDEKKESRWTKKKGDCFLNAILMRK